MEFERRTKKHTQEIGVMKLLVAMKKLQARPTLRNLSHVYLSVAAAIAGECHQPFIV